MQLVLGPWGDGRPCYTTAGRARQEGPGTPQLRHIEDFETAIESSMGGGGLSAFRTLRRLALKNSWRVYLVGGPVRDVLLNAAIKDLDFGVEGDAPALAQQLAEELGGRVVTHPRFMTAALVMPELRIDLVTARREVYPRPGDLPRVFPGSVTDDLSRRDFSINALALPLWENAPQVLDPEGGLADLDAGVVRALHERSFRDDPTRLLRAARYEQRLGFELEGQTRHWLADSVAKGFLRRVSGDRIRHELERIFEEKQPMPALRRAAGLGVLAAIHPAWEKDMLTVGAFSDAFRESFRDGATDYDSLMYLAGLVYHFSPAQGETLTRRLNMPKAWAEVVRDTVHVRGIESRLAKEGLPPSHIYRLLQSLSPVALRAVAKITSSQRVSEALNLFLEKLSGVAPGLSGGDLISLGVPAGPMVSQILERLRDCRLDGQVNTAEDERRWVLEYLRSVDNPAPGD